ncbi:MAG: YnbE family lipoprotein [Halioglobus sp.]
MRILLSASLLLFIVACTPTVAVKAPEEPITINLNVKIEHEIRVKVDKELDELFADDSELF